MLPFSPVPWAYFALPFSLVPWAYFVLPFCLNKTTIALLFNSFFVSFSVLTQTIFKEMAWTEF